MAKEEKQETAFNGDTLVALGKVSGAIMLGNAANAFVPGYFAPLTMLGAGTALIAADETEAGTLLVGYGILNGLKRILVPEQSFKPGLFELLLPGSKNLPRPPKAGPVNGLPMQQLDGLPMRPY